MNLSEVAPNSDHVTPDFTSLAAWESFADGESAADPAQHARCYKGGSLGFLNCVDWSNNGNATDYARVYPADGHRHDGTFNQALAECVAMYTGVDSWLNVEQLKFARFEGLRIQYRNSIGEDAVLAAFNKGADQVRFDGVIVEPGNRSPRDCFSLSRSGTSTSNDHLAYNCIAKGAVHDGFQNGRCYHCLAIECRDNGFEGTEQTRNCIAVDSTNLDYSAITNASGNLSSDGSQGAALDPNDIFQDYAGGIYLPKSAGPAHNTAIGSYVDYDAIGTARPQGPAPDIGPLELLARSACFAGLARRPRLGFMGRTAP